MGKKKGNNKAFQSKNTVERERKDKGKKNMQKNSKKSKGGDVLAKMKSSMKDNKVKGNSIFQIIPEGMDPKGKDKFAALGYDNEEEEEIEDYEIDAEE